MRISWVHILLFLLTLVVTPSLCQGQGLEFIVSDKEKNTPIQLANIHCQTSGQVAQSDENGKALLSMDSLGLWSFELSKIGFINERIQVNYTGGLQQVHIALKPSIAMIDKVSIIQKNNFDIARLASVKGTAIYSAKKNEVILMEKMDINSSTNNSRQIYAKVPGLNIWESDGGGLQLGIGARGLSPKRTSNFNTKQNGYDISADALGYPESYYTPPSEAIERIELVRGAASLQYGTQFGGLLNFVLRKGHDEKKLDLRLRQSFGSFGLSNTFLSVGGTVKKTNYYAYYQRKKGNGWRPNSGFHSDLAYISIYHQWRPKIKIGLEYTFMDYDSQQAGGLTESQFEDDPTQSFRERNWFHVNWNVMSLNVNYKISERAQIDLKNFGLIGRRDALGFLGQINRVDPGMERDLIVGEFNNLGSEIRYIHRYDSLTQESSVFLIGARYYQGRTGNEQGLANSSDDNSYSFVADSLISSSHTYPSQNLAFFAENVFNINSRLSITPGARFEYISTKADGYYIQTSRDLAGNIIFQQTNRDSLVNTRKFALLGLGIGYALNESINSYFNVSQNYRAINFNDLRIVNPNFRIDENLSDEKGYNMDLGIRGTHKKWLNFDVSVFYLNYQNRIGLLLQSDPNTFNVYRYRTNIADSRTIGIESFMEFDMMNLFGLDTLKSRVNVFFNWAQVDSRYISPDEPAIDKNFVELSPQTTFKSGVKYKRENFSISYQFSFTSEHFSDATNAFRTSNAVNGIIPEYHVMDLSMSYYWKKLKFEAGVNNLSNTYYFTRRAASYPGPGIIPADIRSFYVGLELNL